MARLPTLDDLGSRPTPVSNRRIVSDPGAGVVGQALEGFGQTASKIGVQIQEKEDRLSYAAAKSAVLKADVAARQELQDDPDYETWGTRYTEKMKAARAAAAGMIGSRSDRQLFEADAELDTLRGGAELGKLASARRVNARQAVLSEGLTNLQDVGINAPDDATREATIANANELINAGVKDGTIDALKAVEMRRAFTQNYVLQRVEALRTQGDIDGAQKFFDANRSRIEPAAEMRLNEQLHDARQNRDNLMIAEEMVHGGAPTGEAPKLSGAPGSVASELSKAGYSPAVVAGFLGNFEVEGGYGGARGDGGKAAGIAQWHPDRQANFRQVIGKDVGQATHAEQARFVVWEMNNPEKAGMTVAQRDAILRARSPGDAAELIDRHYERSSGAHRSARKEAAVRHASGQTQAPASRDLNAIYGSIDDRAEREGWTPERREAVKAQAARLVDRDEGLLRREQNDAFEGALAKADALGPNFTDPSQLGDAFYRASPADQHRLRAMAQANAAPKEPVANGEVIRSLHVMAIEAPEKLAQANLAQYRPFMTAGEFDEISQAQARAKTQPGPNAWNPRTGIQNAISWGQNFGGVELKDGEDKYRVYRYMEARAREQSVQNGGKPPTENDYQSFFREATREVKFTRSFLGADFLAPDSTERAYKAPSANYKALITRQFKAQFGRNPTDDEVQQWFERMGEVLK